MLSLHLTLLLQSSVLPVSSATAAIPLNGIVMYMETVKSGIQHGTEFDSYSPTNVLGEGYSMDIIQKLENLVCPNAWLVSLAQLGSLGIVSFGARTCDSTALISRHIS